MSSKKIPLSHETTDEASILNKFGKLEKVENPWLKLGIRGFLTGIGSVFVLYMIALIFNFFNFEVLLEIFHNGLLLVFFSAVFFSFSGLSIWFGPSPQWADFRSKVTNRTVKPNNMSESLQNGFKHSITAIVLLLLAA